MTTTITGTTGVSQCQPNSVGVGDIQAAAVLGTVLQSGGLPTGAIFERGSNANGEYIKYADGTMICWAVKPSVISGFAPVGNVFYGGPFPGYTFPATFVGTPVCRIIAPTNGIYQWVTDGTGYASATQTQTFYVMSVSSSSVTVFPSFFAIGRWF